MNNQGGRKQSPLPIAKKRGYHHGSMAKSAIAAVGQLVDEHDGVNFQMKDVARLLGVSEPALYKHFANKADLLIKAAVHGYSIQGSIREEMMAQAGGDPLKQLLAIGEAYVRFCQEAPGFFRMLKLHETHEMLETPEYFEQQKAAISATTELVMRIRDEGDLEFDEPELVLVMFQAAAMGLAQLYLNDKLLMVAPGMQHADNLPHLMFKKTLQSFATPQGLRKIAAL